ncbi:MAG: serine hydrolase domain-containing protein [Flavobacterium sp.]|uniref:serine hydrolase domain-containing protein n=1 Tax=Flavobacterium sp. TaxID=239 RepID=UPI002FC7B6D5
MTLRLFYVLLFIAATLKSTAQDLHLDKVDTFVSLIENNNRGIGSLTIYKGGKSIYDRNFGQASITDKEINKNTKYKIGSITKTFTAVLIFDLIENGSLSLEDKLEKFYPDMPGAKKITILEMLHHSSGLGDFAWTEDNPDWLNQKVTEKQIFDEIKKQGLIFTPGEKQEYSNSGYYLLAKIAEKVSKKEYAVLINEKICLPLGLNNTVSMTKEAKNIYESYTYGADKRWAEVEDFYFPNTTGAGDLAATTADMLTFINSLFTYKILKKETVEKMKPVIENKEYFGMGLMQMPMRNQMFYGHGGDTKGTHSALGYNEKDKVSIAIVLNGERYSRNQFLLGVLSMMYEEDFELPIFKDVEVTRANLDMYAGNYSSPELPIEISIFYDQGILYAQGTDQPPLPLEVYDTHKYQFEQADVKLEFLPDSKQMIFKQGGMVFKMTKK